jgi:hypothetical protein
MSRGVMSGHRLNTVENTLARDIIFSTKSRVARGSLKQDACANVTCGYLDAMVDVCK